MRRGYLCIVYVSSAKPTVLRDLTAALALSSAHKSGVSLAHSFRDESYNRTSFYLLANDAAGLTSPAVSLCRRAYELVDFSSHVGSHPSLGVVDHVSFVPLGEDACSLSATLAARDFSVAINADGSVAVPIYYYGLLSDSQRRLQDLRRALGYFDRPTTEPPSVAALGDVSGRCGASPGAAAALVPDVGSMAAFSASRGVMTLGVVPELVRNLNVRFRFEPAAASGDRGAVEATCRRALATAVTRLIRVPGLVEALTLPYGSLGASDEAVAVEVACNLLRPRQHSAERVEAAARALFERFLSETDGASSGSWQLTDIYTTGPDEDGLLELLAASVRR